MDVDVEGMAEKLDNGSARPTVKPLVDIAEDTSANPKDREAAYEAALEYFLADENDVIENPPLLPVDIYRDIELENGDVVERVVFSCEIRAINDQELLQIKRRARDKIKGPGGVTLADEGDEARMHTLMAAEAITKPNLRDPRILSKFRKPEEALQHMLLSGERISLGMQILRHSGFGNSARSAASLTTEDIEAGKG